MAVFVLEQLCEDTKDADDSAVDLAEGRSSHAEVGPGQHKLEDEAGRREGGLENRVHELCVFLKVRDLRRGDERCPSCSSENEVSCVDDQLVIRRTEHSVGEDLGDHHHCDGPACAYYVDEVGLEDTEGEAYRAEGVDFDEHHFSCFLVELRPQSFIEQDDLQARLSENKSSE